MTRPLIYIQTLGCPKNQVDSRQITGMLKEEGYDFSDLPQAAEIILLNTCGFVDDAKEESVQAILDLARYKNIGLCRCLMVMGCLVQKYGEELAEALPEVDYFFGVGDWPAILTALKAVEPGSRPGRLTIGVPEQLTFNNRWSLGQINEEPSGYIKIAEGCNHHCTFCVIPQIRGGYRSRKPAEIWEEVAFRAARGMREAILIAQDTGSYGRDLQPPSSLAKLIRALCTIEDLSYIRIMYCYPEGVTDELIAAMEHPKVCPYLDMPLQHVSDRLLQKMARPVTSEILHETIKKLRRIPGMVIRSTMMVGFPGETAADFQMLMDFLAEAQLERVGFFAFSPQPGTGAAKLPDQVAEEERMRRLELAQDMQSRILAQVEGRLVGNTLAVLVERQTEEGDGFCHYEGRSFRDAPEIDGMVVFRGRPGLLPGATVAVKITHSQDYILLGEMADESGK